MKMKEAILILLAPIPFIFFFAFYKLGIYETAKLLAFADTSSSLGWNWLSLSCFGIMGFIGIYKAKKLLGVFTTKQIPIILSMAAFPLLTFYSIWDIIPRYFAVGIAFPIQGKSPIPFFVQYTMFTTFNTLPSNLIAMGMFFIFTFILFGKYMNWEALIPAIGMSTATNAAMILGFNEFNIRLVSESSRVLAYWTLFVPGWAVAVLCYIHLWRKVK